jgi:hypothetical protein
MHLVLTNIKTADWLIVKIICLIDVRDLSNWQYVDLYSGAASVSAEHSH